MSFSKSLFFYIKFLFVSFFPSDCFFLSSALSASPAASTHFFSTPHAHKRARAHRHIFRISYLCIVLRTAVSYLRTFKNKNCWSTVYVSRRSLQFLQKKSLYSTLRLLPGHVVSEIIPASVMLHLAAIPGSHRHRIYDRREEALPDGRRSGGDDGLGSRLGRNSTSTSSMAERQSP